MTVDDIKREIERIASLAHDPEAAHIGEDKRERAAVAAAKEANPGADERMLLGAAMRLLRGQANPGEVLRLIRGNL